MAGLPIRYELMTPDPGAVALFCEAALGWEIPASGHSMPNGVEYREIERGDGVTFGAINPRIPKGMAVSWLPYFGVADIEATRFAAKTKGGRVTHNIHEVPGGDFIFTATDPAGAPVGFVGPKGA